MNTLESMVIEGIVQGCTMIKWKGALYHIPTVQKAGNWFQKRSHKNQIIENIKKYGVEVRPGKIVIAQHT